MKPLQKNTQRLLFVSLAVAVLTTFAYWPVRKHQFVDYDDHFYVLENEVVQRGLNADGLQWAFTTGHAANWHPLTWISHMLDCELFGLNPGAHHLVNLLFHVINAVLLLALLFRLTGSLWQSGCVAGMFALHPLHVESVAWISERKDVLSAFFALLSIWFYTNYARQRVTAEQLPKFSPTSAKTNYFFALIFFALGLMTKPMLVTLPFVLLLLDYWPLNRISFTKIKSSLGKLALEKLPFFVLTLISCVVTFLVQKEMGAVAGLASLSVIDRIETTLAAYVAYLGKTLWPQKLAAFYPQVLHPTWQIIGAAFFLLFISAIAVRFASRRPYILFGWLWFFGMLVPVIGLVQVGNQSMADRYTYLPLIGIFIAIAWGAADYFRNPRGRMVIGSVGIVIVGLCVGLTRGQVAHWKNSETLAEHGLRSTTNNYLLLTMLGVVRNEQGRFDEAIALLSDSLKSNADSAIAQGTLATALQKTGRVDEAMAAFNRALELEPSNANVRNNFGSFLLEQGKVDEAIAHLMLALKSKPELPQAHYSLGNAWFRKRDFANAIFHYKEAVRLWPEYAESQCNLGMALIKTGKADAALPHIEAAIRLNPNMGLAHHHHSEILFQSGRFAEAEVASRRAVQLDTQPLIQYQLALALDAQKKWSEAAPILTHVLEVATKARDQRLSNEISQRLASYRNQ